MDPSHHQHQHQHQHYPGGPPSSSPPSSSRSMHHQSHPLTPRGGGGGVVSVNTAGGGGALTNGYHHPSPHHQQHQQHHHQHHQQQQQQHVPAEAHGYAYMQGQGGAPLPPVPAAMVMNGYAAGGRGGAGHPHSHHHPHAHHHHTPRPSSQPSLSQLTQHHRHQPVHPLTPSHSYSHSMGMRLQHPAAPPQPAVSAPPQQLQQHHHQQQQRFHRGPLAHSQSAHALTGHRGGSYSHPTTPQHRTYAGNNPANSSNGGMPSPEAISYTTSAHDFYMFEFRTTFCPLFPEFKCDRAKPYTCTMAHYESHLRRKPVFQLDASGHGDEASGHWNYTSELCSNPSILECPRGNSCRFAHRLQKEHVYHPMLYKTQLCESALHGGECTYGVHCSKAHGEVDLRRPSHPERAHSQPNSRPGSRNSSRPGSRNSRSRPSSRGAPVSSMMSPRNPPVAFTNVPVAATAAKPRIARPTSRTGGALMGEEPASPMTVRALHPSAPSFVPAALDDGGSPLADAMSPTRRPMVASLGRGSSPRRHPMSPGTGPRNRRQGHPRVDSSPQREQNGGRPVRYYAQSGAGGGSRRDRPSEKKRHRNYMYGFRVKTCRAFLEGHCPIEPSECFDAHSRTPRRRKPHLHNGRFNYIPTRCRYVLEDRPCPQGVHCRFAHSTEEVIYHPSKFKTQLCHYPLDPETGRCRGYGVHCAKAHGEEDLRTPVFENPDDGLGSGRSPPTQADLHEFVAPDAEERDADRRFFLFVYKTNKCEGFPWNCQCHNFDYHRNEERRRGPHIQYTPVACPNVKPHPGADWGDPSQCPSGDACKYAHTLLELMYHPQVYKTSLCDHFDEDDPAKWRCVWKRRCAHAHGRADMRTKDDALKEWQALQERIANGENITEGVRRPPLPRSSSSTSSASTGSVGDQQRQQTQQQQQQQRANNRMPSMPSCIEPAVPSSTASPKVEAAQPPPRLIIDEQPLQDIQAIEAAAFHSVALSSTTPKSAGTNAHPFSPANAKQAPAAVDRMVSNPSPASPFPAALSFPRSPDTTTPLPRGRNTSPLTIGPIGKRSAFEARASSGSPSEGALELNRPSVLSSRLLQITASLSKPKSLFPMSAPGSATCTPRPRVVDNKAAFQRQLVQLQNELEAEADLPDRGRALLCSTCRDGDEQQRLLTAAENSLPAVSADYTMDLQPMSEAATRDGAATYAVPPSSELAQVVGSEDCALFVKVLPMRDPMLAHKAAVLVQSSLPVIAALHDASAKALLLLGVVRPGLTTLEQVVGKLNSGALGWERTVADLDVRSVARGLLTALSPLHDAGFGSGNVTPAGVAVGEGASVQLECPVFFAAAPTDHSVPMAPWDAPETSGADAGNERALRPCTPSEDMFSVGCVLHYLLTLGAHPLGPKCDQSVVAAARALRDMTPAEVADRLAFDDVLEPVAAHLVRLLVQPKAAGRLPTAQRALAHPFFWDGDKQLRLLACTADALGNAPEKFARAFNALADEVISPPHSTWQDAVHPCVIDEYADPQCARLQDLLVLVRRLSSTPHKLSPAASKVLLPGAVSPFSRFDSSLARMVAGYFTARFPRLFIAMYSALESDQLWREWDERRFAPFFQAC